MLERIVGSTSSSSNIQKAIDENWLKKNLYATKSTVKPLGLKY